VRSAVYGDQLYTRTGMWMLRRQRSLGTSFPPPLNASITILTDPRATSNRAAKLVTSSQVAKEHVQYAVHPHHPCTTAASTNTGTTHQGSTIPHRTQAPNFPTSHNPIHNPPNPSIPPPRTSTILPTPLVRTSIKPLQKLAMRLLLLLMIQRRIMEI
jgi:hypothetical protein